MALLPHLSIILTLLGLCTVVHSTPVQVTFTYLSKYNDFAEFITMYTLCLAPLATHIAFGIGKTVIVAGKGPGWMDRLTDFNPISITWRYYAIAYRRLRGKQWDAADMAACNARFWDGERWDGSEYMMIKSRDYLTHGPEKPHAILISGSSVATLALVLQGVQALYYIGSSASLTSNVNSTSSFFIIALPTLFLPISLLGVLRLPAAFWISDDFVYKYAGDHPPLLHTSPTTESGPDEWKYAVKHRLLETRNWRCIGYRVWWIASIGVTIGLGFWDIINSFIVDTEVIYMSLTCILYLVMYMQLTGGMMIIHFIYVLKHEHVSTIIPCSQKMWYKVLTSMMIATAFATVVVASLETIRLPNGIYITGPLADCSENGVCSLNTTSFIVEAEGDWLAFFARVGVS